VLLDLAHGRVDLGADVGRLGQGQQEVEARLGGKVEDVVGVVGGGFIDAAAAAGGGAGLVQFCALDGEAHVGEAHVGEAQEDQAKDGAGVFLRLEAGVGAELIGGVPQALLQRGGGNVLLGGFGPV